MKVILFGATGMVGQGVLRECALDPEVTEVLSVGRRSLGAKPAKVRELIREDFTQYADVEEALRGYDACLFCLGVSSSGMSEAEYHRVTYELCLAAAQTLCQLNPEMTFIFVSGAGTDSSEKGRSMWARVKGKTENALLKLPFKAVYLFRPAFIQPLHGITSRTPMYRAFYAVLGPLYPLWKVLFPGYVTNTEWVGRAMLRAAKQGAPKAHLENRDINQLATAA